MTVKISKAKNKSSNTESIGTSQLLNKFMADGLNIASITTDGSKAFERLLKAEFLNFTHYLNLWYILRNIYCKFHPKFAVVSFFIIILNLLFNFFYYLINYYLSYVI